MKTKMVKKLMLAIVCLSFFTSAFSQTTYVNPIQPEDHPDQTIMRVGSDFYSTGSNFHFNPYVCIVHSTDLVHWEIIARVVPSNWSALASDATGSGTWQGALAQFGGYFWVYFSNAAGSGQYFSKATAMTGPWSTPTKVSASTVTGYDNSIFVDDDGTPYMLMKNGQYVNRIQQIDKTTGQLTGTLINLDWINGSGQYSWAEGPVMCKYNGRYYYFVAGNVSGGQYVLSTSVLSADSTYWIRHGNFFNTATSPGGFTGPNHITQPIKLDDGTWWCLSHAYDNNGWKGQGRIGLLHQVTWDASNVPHGIPPNTAPVSAPSLPNTNNILFNLPKEDYFTSSTLNLNWHFLNKTNATTYSLTASSGNLRLTAGTTTTHILQKEGGHYYSMITKVNVNATATGNEAGLRIMNGKDDLFATLYSGYNGAKKIGFAFNGSTTEINNTIGNVVWLKIERELHNIKGFYSADGTTWTQVGGTIDISTLDNYSTNYNEWVGTSIGLYAKSITADFDLFKYRDGFSAIKVAGYNNFSGVTTSTKTPGAIVTNSATGDWLMLGGISMDNAGIASNTIEVNAASASGSGSLEVWINNTTLAANKIATIPITASGGADVWKNYTANVSVTGQHDVYLKFVGTAGAFSVNTVRFIVNQGAPTVSITAPTATNTYTSPATIAITATAADANGTIAKVEFYNGTTLLGSATTSPYSYNWTNVVFGNYSITAVATDNSGLKTTSTPVAVRVAAPAVYGTITLNAKGVIGNEILNIEVDGTVIQSWKVTTAYANYTTTANINGLIHVNYTNDSATMDAQVDYIIVAATTYQAEDQVKNTSFYANGSCGGAGNSEIMHCNGYIEFLTTPVTTIPASPTATATVSYCQNIIASALTATGTALKWYTMATTGTALTTTPVPSTIATGTTDYYVSQTVGGVESNRTKISVVVTATPAAPTVISTINYNLGTTATALTATGTNLKWYTVATGGTALASAPVPSTTATGTTSYFVSQSTGTCESSRAKIDVIIINQVVIKVSLVAGWNIIGYPLDGSANIATALSSIWSNVLTVKNLDSFYDSINSSILNSLTKLEWGKGYLVKVSAPCEITWTK
jgi:beta-xylosidase